MLLRVLRKKCGFVWAFSSDSPAAPWRRSGSKRSSAARWAFCMAEEYQMADHFGPSAYTLYSLTTSLAWTW